MSNYEQHIGRIKPIYQLPKESFENYTKRVFEDNFNQKAYNSYEEDKHYLSFADDCGLYQKVFLINYIWYKIIEPKEIDPYDDIQELIPQSDGSFIYVMRFYNGGTYLGEMIHDAIENLNK